MLETAAAALRDDGILLVSIPNGYGPYEIEQFLIRKGILGLSLALVRRGCPTRRAREAGVARRASTRS